MDEYRSPVRHPSSFRWASEEHDINKGWMEPDDDRFKVYKVHDHLYWSFSYDSVLQIRWNVRMNAFLQNDLTKAEPYWMTGPGDAPSDDERYGGMMQYDTEKEMLTAWRYIMENPEAFMVLKSLG